MAEQDRDQNQSPDMVPFSNGIRLTLREWIGVGIFTAFFAILAPVLWRQVEPFPLEADYRIPHDLGNDYWLYARHAALAAEHYDTILIGDSVVWGEYVTRQQTLSHYLNELSGRDHCANLGLDGAHPLALTGLVESYTPGNSGKTVVLQCNPLWMSSLRADLQDEKVTEFNHPRLVPQFVPYIPSYPINFEKRAEISPHIGILVERHVSLFSWSNHLQQAYYDKSDIPSWTLEHPYEDPLKPLRRGLPPSDNSLRHLPQPWYKSGIEPQDYPWVEMETSLQWQAFRQVVKTLQQRGNRVFVLVGPFNEHLLKPESLLRYQKVKATIAAWMREQQVPHMVPPPLPSDQYGDASHPLAAGYASLARQLLEKSFFRDSPRGTTGR
jgi:hypothetical protein